LRDDDIVSIYCQKKKLGSDQQRQIFVVQI